MVAANTVNPLTPQQRSNRLRDQWVDAMVDLVAIENRVATKAKRDLIRARKEIAAQVANYFHAPDDPIEQSHLITLAAIARSRLEIAWTNARESIRAETEGFTRRWFLVSSRIIVRHLSADQRRAVLETAPARALARIGGRFSEADEFSPRIRERDVDVSLRISISDLIADLFGLFDGAGVLAVESSAAATEWLRRIDVAAAGNIDRTLEALSQSIDLGETMQEASERVTSIVAQSEFSIDRISRTHIQTLAFETNEELADYIGEAVETVAYETMLDSRVCTTCAPDHGKEFRTDDTSRPTLPRHPMCRCAYVIVLKDTPPPDQDDYPAWLARQSDKRRAEILGPSRKKLFDAGFPIEGFTNNAGRQLRLDELPDPDKYRDMIRRRKKKESGE